MKARVHLWLVLAVMAACAAPALGAAPVISNVFPDFVGVHGPKIITGEGFDPQKTQVWQVQLPSDEGLARVGMERLGGKPAPLPETPPKSAQRVNVLDVEEQVITAHVTGDIVWVTGPGGVSKPFLLHAAKPFWLSDAKARPGQLLHVYGFGLRAQYRKSQVLLRSTDPLLDEAKTYVARQVIEARSPRTADPRLIYFEVPPDAAPGSYQVYLHNGMCGEFGWVKAGTIEVAAPEPKPSQVLDVRSFGAKGDGLANDLAAIRAALAAAQKAKGATVFFPPGAYRIDETLVVPPGVTLRGASRDACIIQGTGYDPHGPRTAWFTLPSGPPAAVVRLTDRTGIESLTIEGAVSKGAGGRAPLEAVPQTLIMPGGGEVADVAIRNCRIVGREEDLATRNNLYRSAVFIGPNSRRIQLLDNDVYGSVNFMYGTTVRSEIIGNRIHGGAASDVVTLSANGIDCLLDGNILMDTPGRIVFNPIRHCHIRYNEVHQAFRGTWANAEEIYLVHGGGGKTLGVPTAAGPDTLTDARQHWRPDQYRDATVLIIAGRGFGQYRVVTGNTAETLKLAQPWRVPPDATSQYAVGTMFVENAFFANLNNTNCRFSLWLDCVACIVDMHRDAFAGGADLWGSDRTGRDKEGKLTNPERFHPAYYNAFENCWFDGSLIHLWSGATANNLAVGPVMFANYVVRNKIRQAHMKRTGFNWFNPHALGGVIVGNRSGKDMTKPQTARAGLSHSIVANNFISFTNVGVAVADFARKTFLLDNEFQEVEQPILDWGARTLARGNKTHLLDEKGEHAGKLPDISGERALDPPPKPKPIAAAPPGPPLAPTIRDVHVLVSQPAYCFYTGVNDPAAEQACAANLKKLYALIRAYESRHGHLPKAAWFPEKPQSDPDSIAVLLGEAARPLLVCPTCGPDFQRMGLTYIWNEKLSGTKLADVKDPAATWLMMDFVGTHDWMVSVKSCGHRGGVNILYADGSVKWAEPPTQKEWAEWAAR